MSTSTKPPAEFVVQEDDDQVQIAFDANDVIVVGKATKKARVKGTWHMVYGTFTEDFVDGQVYELPFEVFNYLRARGNIYDTMF